MRTDLMRAAVVVLSLTTALVAPSRGDVAVIPSQWLAPASGSWTDGSRWSTAPNYPTEHQPNQGDAYHAIISAAGAPYTVALNDHATVQALTIGSSDATLALDTVTLRILEDLALDGGAITLTNPEALHDSAIVEFLSDGGSHAIQGDGVIRALSGRINSIQFPGNGSLDIGAGVNYDVAAGIAQVLGGTLVNRGAITSQPGAEMDIAANNFTNNGLIEVAGFTTIGRDRNSPWRNEGTIRVKSGGSLTLYGQFTPDDLGTLIDEGADRVWLGGVLDNTGNTLDLSALNLTVPLTLNGGEIRGGVITSSGSGSLGFVSNICTLNGVTLATNVTMPSFSRVFVENGLTLDNITLTMPEGAGLSFFGAQQALAGTATIFAPDEPQTSAITRIEGDKLVIGEDIVIRNGSNAYRELAVAFKENRGTIVAEAPNSLVTIGLPGLFVEPSWTNNGLIRALAGELQFIGKYAVENIGALEVTGGTVFLRGEIENEGRTLLHDADEGLWKIQARVNGGRIDTADGRVADVAGEFYGVTIAGDVALFDDLGSTALGSLWARAGLTFDDGTLTIGPFAELNVNEPLVIDGRGTILLNGGVDRTAVQTYTGAILTIGPEIIVKTGPTGGGAISRNNLPVLNQGTISAETPLQTLVVDGRLENTGTLQAINGSVLRIDDDDWTNRGRMHVEAAKILISSASFENSAGGEITGSGEIQMIATPLVNNGLISPGMSVGELLFRGSVELEPSSLLRLELQGTGVGQRDRITVVGGSLTLGGELGVALSAGFQPKLGDQFEVLTAPTISGGFAMPGDVVSYGPFEFRIDVGATNVILTTTATPEPAAWIVAVGCAAPLALRRRGNSDSRKLAVR